MEKQAKAIFLVCFLILIGGQTIDSQQEGSDALPPVMKDIPDIEVQQNSENNQVVDLWDYVSDEDTSKDRILFSLIVPRRHYTEGSANVTLDQNRYINIKPETNWTGGENITVEANDGQSIDYDTFKVTVSSIEEGTLIEAEDSSLVSQKGNWANMFRWMREGLLSNKPGDSLEFAFEGSHLSICFWGRDLHFDHTYYRNPVTRQPWGVPKYYRAGKAVINIDGKLQTKIDLSQADNQGWSEIFVPDLVPGEHKAEIIVEDGFVCVDRIRYGTHPFIRVRGSVLDEYKTPLADVLVRFLREGHPDFILRTSIDGKIPTYTGLKEGIYSISIESDSAPGYFRPPDPEEYLLSKVVHDIALKGGMSRTLDVILNYESRDYRSLGLIRRPVGSIPSILKRGETLRIECRFTSVPEKVIAVLKNGSKEFDLEILSSKSETISNGFEEGLVVLAKIPKNVPEELYDLKISLDSQQDKARRAVKVLKSYKNPYRIAHFSDLHIRSAKANSDHAKMLRAAAEQIGQHNPDFVILTGDITDVGARPEYLRLLQALNLFRVPTYVIPGNHDFYSDGRRYFYRGYDEYRKYLGQPFYKFSYGEDTFVCVNTGGYSRIHDSAVPGVHSNQWEWLTQILEEEKARTEHLLAFIAHWDYTHAIGNFYREYNQFESLFRVYPIDVHFLGHRHRHLTTQIKGTDVFLIETGSLIRGNYRIIEIKDSQVIGHPTYVLKKNP